MADAALSPQAISSGVPLPAHRTPRLPVFALGLSLSTFLVVTYVLCTVFDLWFPQYAMNPIWSPLLPGYVWLSWPSFFLGLVEVTSYGWYVALVYGPIHNFFIGRYR